MKRPWQWMAALTLAMLTAACGGGGSGGTAASSSGTSTGATSFAPTSETDRLYFAGYELASDSTSRGSGYITNEVDSSGQLRRRLYQASSGAYADASSVYSVAQILDMADISLSADRWLTKATADANFILAADGSGYVLHVNSLATLRIDNVREQDISGQSFTSVMPSGSLGSVTGVFPSGSRLYLARLTSLREFEVYGAVNSVFTGSASADYLTHNYSGPGRAYCLPDNRVLAFPTRTTAVSYPKQSTLSTGCLGNALGATVSYTVSVHNTTSTWHFDVQGGTLTTAALERPMLATAGTATAAIGIAVMAGSTSGTVHISSEGVSYRHPSGTQGEYFRANGPRMNKIALNALLAGFGLPLVP